MGGIFGRELTKSYLNIEGIDLFVKILVFCQDFGIMKKEGEFAVKFMCINIVIKIFHTRF